MKMKKIFYFSVYNIVILLILSGIIYSCDKLEPPYSTVKGGGIDTMNKRTILLEDYTGHKCVNCPGATAIAKTLDSIYMGKVIVMAVHAGMFASPDPSGLYTANYQTNEGTYWFSPNGFNLVGTPMGMVDRADFNGTKPLMDGSWTAAVVTEFAKAKEAIVSVTATSTDGSTQASASIKTRFLSARNGTFMLHVCILEDSVISAQKNGDSKIGPKPDIVNYVHMHMLRQTPTGNLGEVLARNPDNVQVFSKNYNITLNPAWKVKHLSVVAFVADSTSKTVVQAAKVHL
jgi:hypothetical protein